MSLLDDLIFGLRDVYDAEGKPLPTRSKVQFGRGLSATDNPATGRIEVHAEEVGGGEGVATLATLDELRAIPSAGLGPELRLVEETGILWRYDGAGGASEIDDSNLSVKPADKGQDAPGRWRPVVSHGKPGIAIGGGNYLTVSYLPAGVQVIGAKPVVDGAPTGAGLFSGFAVDIGDENGSKRPSPLLGLTSEGSWMFASLNWSTLQQVQLYMFDPDGLRINATSGAKCIRVETRPGQAYSHADLSFEIAAGSKDAAGVVAGDIAVSGGDNLQGTGGNAIVKPGKSEVGAARRGVAALCDEDEVPIVSATRDENGMATLAFFNGTHVSKPVVTGSRSDGSAALSLLDALTALGLVEDQTTP